MATFTVRKNGKQSKPIKPNQVFSLLNKGQIDESDDVIIVMKVEEFTKSSFAKQQALDESIKNRLSQLKEAKKSYAEMKSMVAEAETHTDAIQMWVSQRAEVEKEVQSLKESKRQHMQELESLKQQIESMPDEIAAIEVGIHSRDFEFEAPESYRRAMDEVTDSKKRLLKSGGACSAEHDNWTVDGSLAKGRKMIKEQCDLMLRGFNGEVDTALTKVKHGNLDSISQRVSRAFDQINKLGKVKQVSISIKYLDLVLKELRLTNEWEILKQEQKEREREIKAQMREEARAEKEIEKARKDAEKEEELKQRALEDARNELLQQHGEQNAKLESLVSKLELELQEAIDRKAKAIARASLTKSGHVYIISNVGTMGENVFKIGMTRRLVPQERVDELGDASVPFPFDVHAMIYTTDAPSLENSLHKKFEASMVNKVNRRREFFAVSLDEIREAVTELHGDVTWVIEPAAMQFRESQRMGEVVCSS